MNSCSCTLGQKLVGDGCSICNPQSNADLVIDFDSDEPLVCPLDKVDGETCESCQ